MLGDEHGGGKVYGKLGKYLRESLGAAGGGSDGDDGELAGVERADGVAPGRDVARQRRRWSDQAGDGTELLQQGLGADEVAGEAEDGGVDGVERAVAHGFEDEIAVAGGGGGDDQDDAGSGLHDAACGLGAVDAGHDEVHEDDVGAGDVA